MDVSKHIQEKRALAAQCDAQRVAIMRLEKERDVVTSRYHDGMKALLWLVQLHAKAEAEDEIEEALEVAEEKLAIWMKIREANRCH